MLVNRKLAHRLVGKFHCWVLKKKLFVVFLHTVYTGGCGHLIDISEVCSTRDIDANDLGEEIFSRTNEAA